MIPVKLPWKWIIIAGLIVAALGMLWAAHLDYGAEQRAAGAKGVQDKWDEAVRRGKAEVARLKSEAGKVTTVTEVKYVDRVQYIREKGETIVKTVEVFVPVTSDPKLNYVDGGFRVFHDAAASNTIPNPAEIPNAAPTTLTEVAATVAENYERANVCFATVEAWQEWATAQCKLNKNGCPPNG